MKFPIFIEVFIKSLLEVDAKKLLDLPLVYYYAYCLVLSPS